ncbi:MAG: hypothetical protein WA734_08370 [Candidatus Acidiferrales bacterium]
MLLSLFPRRDIEQQVRHRVHLATELSKLAIGILLRDRTKKSSEFLQLIGWLRLRVSRPHVGTLPRMMVSAKAGGYAASGNIARLFRFSSPVMLVSRFDKFLVRGAA